MDNKLMFILTKDFVLVNIKILKRLNTKQPIKVQLSTQSFCFKKKANVIINFWVPVKFTILCRLSSLPALPYFNQI